jgi:photosystem II stability/assembly factor-like uncharacterized protein
MTPHRLYVGTIGEGLFRSVDGGTTYRRACDGTFVECDVRALTIHPDNPNVLYMGSELGLFVSMDGAENWSRLEATPAGLQVWALWLMPGRPEVMVVGTCPSRLFRTEDGGRSWTEPKCQIVADCPRIMHTRVTSFASDPAEPETVWAGIEIDGLRRSRDGGRTWEAIGTGISSRDFHAIAIVPARNGQPRRLLAATNNDLNLSTDDGATWRPLNVGQWLPWSYCRALAQPVGRPETILLGSGDAPPGSEGLVARSTDGGATWQVADMPGRSNSTMWNFAVHPADPNLLYAASVGGEVYRSLDGGASWRKLAREFGEIRALAWAPA